MAVNPYAHVAAPPDADAATMPAPDPDARFFLADPDLLRRVELKALLFGLFLCLWLPPLGLIWLYRTRRARHLPGEPVLVIGAGEIRGYDVTGPRPRLVRLPRDGMVKLAVVWGDRIGVSGEEGVYHLLSIDLLSPPQRVEALALLGLRPFGT